MKYYLVYKELIFFSHEVLCHLKFIHVLKCSFNQSTFIVFVVARASKLNEFHYQTGREGTSKETIFFMKVILERAKICLINRPLEIYQKFTVTKVIPI